MAIIGGFTTFGTQANLTLSQVDGAFDAFVTVYGGTKSTGSVVPGAVDSTNLKAKAALTNGMKAVGTSLTQVSFGPVTLGTASGQGIRSIKAPYNLTISGIDAAFRDTTGAINQSVTTGSLLVYCYRNGGYVQVGSTMSFAGVKGLAQAGSDVVASGISNTGFPVYAGESLTLDNTAMTYGGAATGLDGMHVTLHIRVGHY